MITKGFAERVLGGSPPRHCRIRAASVRVLALALVDRSTEALAAADALLADVAAGPTSPYAQGVAHIAAAVAPRCTGAPETEFRMLLARRGFRLERLVSTESPAGLGVIEAVLV